MPCHMDNMEPSRSEAEYMKAARLLSCVLRAMKKPITRLGERSSEHNRQI